MPDAPPPPAVHAIAATGFDRAGADYERGRPGYPAAALAHLTATLDLRPGRTLLDLAAGTGKLTRPLLGTGARVIAVEPVAGMRAQLTASVPGLEVRDGTAEAIPLTDGACDAVTVAQAFHWFDAAAAAAEIHRVLAPDGRLAVIWNAWDEEVAWVADVMAIVHAHSGGAPQQRTSPWPEEVRATGRFGALREARFGHVVHGDRQTLVARVLSTSYIAALDEPGREQVVRDVLAVADRHPQTADQATLAMPYTTHVVWAERR